MKKYIFFDFDGTISDARKIAVESLKKTLEDFGRRYDDKMKKFLGERMEIAFKKLGIKENQIKSFRRRYYRYFKKAALNGGIKLCVSMGPLFELKKEGYRLIVVSNAETSFIKACARKLKVKKLFKKIYGANKFKTKNEFLKKLFKKYKIRPQDTFYIGDRFSDVEFAKKVGCVSVAIHNKCSWSSLQDVVKEKPDFLIKDFKGLRKIVRNF